MHRTTTLAATALVLCTMAGQIVVSLGLSQGRTIITSGTVMQNGSEITFLKFVNAWGLRSPVPQEIVEHMAKFDLIATDFNIEEYAQQIKQLNPQAVILGYKDVMMMNLEMEDWDIVDQHENWFVHDIHGNRLLNKYWDCYCMDVGNQEWRQHYVDYIKQKFDLYAFDGVFADDVWSELWKDDWTVPPEDVPDYADWHQQMIDFILYARSQVPAKIFISNTPNNGDYADVSDGKVWEGLGQYDMQWTLEDIDALTRISVEDKYCLAWSKNFQKDTLTTMQYGLGCHLLGVNGSKAYFGWNNIWSESKGHYPEFDDIKLLSNPTNKYYSYQSVYARDFENGKVLVNPSSNTYTVDLQGTYITLNGETITEITMMNHSGAILKKG